MERKRLHQLEANQGPLGFNVMQAIVFQCPVTGFDVQQLVDDGEDQPREDGTRHYKGMTCAACDGLHFVDPSTGKVLGETLNRRPATVSEFARS